MSWQGILEHEAVVERFRRALASGRLASSFLFVGPEGVGKCSFAVQLAKALLCLEHPEADLNPCGRCPSCQQVDAGTHPDLLRVSKPKDKSDIPVALFIGDQEHRMREGLCHDIGLKPFMGGRKVAIIDDADDLNDEGANCLLKTLEEPPPRSVLILIGTSAARQLPTIRSRCQIVPFRPLSSAAVAELLLAGGHVTDAAAARRAAEHSEGSIARAVELLDDDLWQFRTELFARLAEPPSLQRLQFMKAVQAFVDAAGKEAKAKRERLRHVLRFATAFHRAWLRAACGGETDPDAELQSLAQRATQSVSDDVEAISAALEQCLASLEYTERNATAANIIEHWWDKSGRVVVAGVAV